LASRTKKAKGSSSRGQPTPRGKRATGSKAAAGSLRDKAKAAEPRREKAAPERSATLTVVKRAKSSERTAHAAAAKRVEPATEVKSADSAPTRAPSRPRLVSVSSGIQNSSSAPAPAPPSLAIATPDTRQAGSSPGERDTAPHQAGDVFGYATQRGAVPASLSLLELNTRVLDLLTQQSQVSFSAMQAVLTAKSVADALRAQADGVSRVLDLQKAQWLEMTTAFGRAVEGAAQPVRAASLWRVH
jgi:hypothetical protein